jgi:hypothetical protein
MLVLSQVSFLDPSDDHQQRTPQYQQKFAQVVVTLR